MTFWTLSGLLVVLACCNDTGSRVGDAGMLDGALGDAVSGVDAARPEGFFAALNGTPEGNGSFESPWDLETALGAAGNPPGMEEGARLWVRGGSYRGEFFSGLVGSAEAPIHVRPYPGEHVRIDAQKDAHDDRGNGLTISGEHTWFFDFEVTCIDGNEYRGGREGEGTNLSGSVATLGRHLKIIDFVVHNTVGGFFNSANPTGLGSDVEFYGGASFSNGYRVFGDSRDHGHGVYVQNVIENEPTLLQQVLVFNNFSQSYQCRSSSNANFPGQGGKADRCHVIDSVFYKGVGLFEGGGADPGRLPTDHRLDGSLLFRAGWRFGQSALHQDNSAQGNTFVNSSLELNNILDFRAQDNTFIRTSNGGSSYNILQYIFNTNSVNFFDDAVDFSGTRFEGPTRIGRGADDFLGGTGTLSVDWSVWNAVHSGPSPAEPPVEPLVRLWKHKYLSGRGTVAIVRFDGRSEVPVDLSELDLVPGSTVEIIWGLDPVLQGEDGLGMRVVESFVYDGSLWMAKLTDRTIAGRNGYEEPGIVQEAYEDDLHVFFVRTR